MKRQLLHYLLIGIAIPAIGIQAYKALAQAPSSGRDTRGAALAVTEFGALTKTLYRASNGDLSGTPDYVGPTAELEGPYYFLETADVAYRLASARQRAEKIFIVPNPFSKVTAIDYKLPEEGEVDLALFNNSGQKVVTLHTEFESAGSHQYLFDGSKLRPGTYYCRLSLNGIAIAGKQMIVVR